MRFAYKLTKSTADAQDLVQEASLKAYKKKDQLDTPEKFKPWFGKLMYHTFISNYNQVKRRSNLIEMKGAHSSLFFNKVKTYNHGLENLKYQDLLKLSERISPKFNAAFNLYHKGYSYKEISAKLSVPVGTVKSRINTARNKLKSALNIISSRRA